MIITKPEQLTWLKDNYEILEKDVVCPKSLNYCKVKEQYTKENKDLRIMRILILNEGKKKITDKLKLKGISVKAFNDVALND